MILDMILAILAVIAILFVGLPLIGISLVHWKKTLQLLMYLIAIIVAFVIAFSVQHSDKILMMVSFLLGLGAIYMSWLGLMSEKKQYFGAIFFLVGGLFLLYGTLIISRQ